tara:strand:- start:86 stop:487 length:402 start_codon:yes stop_codon:yes gene_type:complete
MEATKMLTLKKIWVWLKSHWYFPLLLVLLAVTYFSGRARTKRIIKMFEISKESYEKQIKEINETHQKELKKQEELYNTYLDTMKRLQKEHNVDLENLEKEKMVKLDKMVKKYKGSPEDLAKELSEMFGVDNET